MDFGSKLGFLLSRSMFWAAAAALKHEEWLLHAPQVLTYQTEKPGVISLGMEIFTLGRYSKRLQIWFKFENFSIFRIPEYAHKTKKI